MDKILAYFVLVIVAAVIIFGEIYFKLERSRTIALTILNTVDFKPWLGAVSRMFSFLPCEYQEQYAAVLNNYNSLSSRQARQKPEFINQLLDISKKAISENLNNESAVSNAKEAGILYSYIFSPLDEYNAEAAKLNRMLDWKIISGVGKLFRFVPLTKVKELTIV